MAQKKNIAQYKTDILKRYDEGESIRSIARAYDFAHKSVAGFIKKHREIRVPKGRQEAVLAQIHPLYQSGLSIKEISLRLGIAYSTVRTTLVRDYGVEIEAGTNPRKYEHLAESFCKDYASGLSLEEIASRYQVSRSTVRDYLSNQQIKARGYSESSRLYDLDETYFQDLTPEKSFQLGMIYK